MRPIALIFAAVTLLAGIAVSWLIAAQTISWIEASQRAEMEQAFYAGGISWAEAEADGFIVTLSGTAPTAADQERAVKIARLIFAGNLRDATTAQQAAMAAPPAAPPMVEILKNGNDFSFIGVLPTGETARVFADYLAALGPDAKITDVTETTENAPQNWLPAFEYALRLAPLADQATLTVTPGAVALEAVATSASWEQGFAEMAEKLRPENVNLSVNIAVPRPVISPYVFSLDIANPALATCSAQDEAEAAILTTAATDLIGTKLECDIGIGAPSRKWAEAVDAGLHALAGLGGGRIAISDADFALFGPTGAAPADFTTIADTLRADLPEGFTLQATPAPRPAPAAPAPRPVTFTATLSADGGVVIKGSVKDILTREVVMRFSEAKFGYGRVEDRLWLEPDLPDGWQVRVFALIEALALLNEGTASMTPAALEITGDASFQNPAAELGKLLDPAYGPGQTSFDISYTEQMNRAADAGLDPRLCVSRISSLLANNTITFAPSSAVISDPSLPTIAAIADILTQCRDARIEIGGHTDSQGREEMNLTLSQSRADAVLDALLAQNLLLGDLSAKGYGETQPIADNDTEAGRTRNRRIEFKLLRDTAAPEVTTGEISPATAPAAAATSARIVIKTFRRPAFRAPAAPSGN